MGKKIFSVLKVVGLFSLLVFSLSCSNSTNDNANGPVLSLISPSSRAAAMPSFKLTATGSGFSEDSEIIFNGSSITTTFVSSKELSGIITSDAIKNSKGSVREGTGHRNSEIKISVLVKNKGGGSSGTLFFSLRENNSFRNPVIIASAASGSFNPVTTTDGQGGILVLFERYDEQEKMYYISQVRSGDGGSTWSIPLDIFSSDERAYNPDIALSPDGNIYAAFYCRRLWFTLSSDSGASWTEPQPLTPDTPVPVQSKISAQEGGIIYIAWILRTYSGDPSVYFMRSDDGGTGFTVPENISSGKDYFNHVFDLNMKAAGNAVYISWTAWPKEASRYSHVYLNHSSDGGTTWLSEDEYFPVCSSSAIGLDPFSNLYFTVSSSYIPFMNQIELYAASVPGVNWGSGIAVTDRFNDRYPLTGCDSEGNINILFLRDGVYYYTRSIDRGMSWSGLVFLTDRISDSYENRLIGITVDGEGTIYVVSEYDNSGALYFTSSY